MEIVKHIINMSDLKTIACDAIDASAAELAELCNDIWSHPELGLEETHAHRVLTDFLERHGFQVERSYKLNTAFRATYSYPPTAQTPNIAFICEYDALPNIGHACGHNLISEEGVAAGIGLMAAMKASKSPFGRVTVLGTPGEEEHGAKSDLIQAGAFLDVDVAMKSHPYSVNDSVPGIVAKESIQITYSGKASHAAGYPWEGINALDAAVICYQGIACLRQQMKPIWQAQCVIKEGGVKSNIIPEKAVLEVAIRAPTDTELATLKDKMAAIFEASAKATGCQMEYCTINNIYSSMIHNIPLVALYEANLSPLLPAGVPTQRAAPSGSTDMGNVSHVVPSLYSHFYIGGVATNHNRGFAADAGNARAQPFTLIQAKALAMTAIDIMLDPGTLKHVTEAFSEDMKKA